MTEVTECEVVRLPMVCVCGAPDKPNVRKEKADARRKQAQELLTCTDENFMSRAVGNLYWSFNAKFDCAVDQWFGAYAKVKKFVECEHRAYEKARDAGLTEAEADALDDCPDEPECFVYRWDDVLKISVDCDRLEDGLAELVIWFHENRKDQDE